MIRATALDMDMAAGRHPGAHHRRRGLPAGSMLAGSAGLLVAPLFLPIRPWAGRGLKRCGGRHRLFGNLYGRCWRDCCSRRGNAGGGATFLGLPRCHFLLIMVGFLFVRPQGLFGEKQSERV